MTDDYLTEWKYRYSERIGIMCGDSEPTREQIEYAYKETDLTTPKE